MTWKPTRDQKVLMFDPWEGGKGDERVRTFRDGFVVTRYPHTCAICFERIPACARVRAQTQINLDSAKHQVMTFRFCAACCEAMAAAWNWADDGEAICARYVMGDRKRNPRKYANR